MSLQLLLMRHGEAAFSSPDEMRELTQRGREHTLQVSRECLDSLAGIDRVYVSPYLRAKQTLQLIGSLAELPAAETYAGLTPDSDIDALIEWLQPQQGKVLLVAHNPLLSRLLSQLLGDSGHYGFDTSTMAQLTMPLAASGCAELDWIKYPR
ncbi:phosphohistidine phosphatase SixA [Motiliproteus coralliicola]|uniref:Phosphohistidine phosphatase SixA n=1 Tax=Motiliproteus coralliicola TaxID=2283196 RepID=A0A369WRD2_9GAMM|nr:phosphohistidine phosphatase SixA [Motiliproteus coralliicola]RDE24227.1 phosphohistidine phosphatase SixA [Motiliproteus coralliicola]